MTKSPRADARQAQSFVGFSSIGFFCVSGFLPLACTVCGGFSGVFCAAFSAATSPQYFEVVDGIINSWFGTLILISSLWAVWYHLLGGLRHLIWDRAIGLDLKTAEYLGWAVILGSFLLTITTVVILW